MVIIRMVVMMVLLMVMIALLAIYVYYDEVSVSLCVTKNPHFRADCRRLEARRLRGLAGRRPALA